MPVQGTLLEITSNGAKTNMTIADCRLQTADCRLELRIVDCRLGLPTETDD